MEDYNLLVVSDLHLGEGLDPDTGRYSRMEDFLFDGAFARFLRYQERIRQQPHFGGRPWKLIMNGDLLDFVQVTSLPREGFRLREVRGVTHCKELSTDERKNGLGTTCKESAWKVTRIARGHQRLFAALGRFVSQGNHIVVITGNHDIELYWPEVRRQFVIEIEKAHEKERKMTGEGESVALSDIKARLHFCPWFYYEPGRVYIEHGGQYESSSHFPDILNPVSPDDPERIQVLWGWLFGRYLFNQVEKAHPFADNFKPPTRYILWALRRAPFTTFWLLLSRGSIFLCAVRSWWHSRAKHEKPPCEDILPCEITHEIEALAHKWSSASRQEWFGMLILGVLAVLAIGLATVGVVKLIFEPWTEAYVWLAAAALIYLLSRFAATKVSTFDDFFQRVAEEVEQTLKPTHSVPYIVFGHDHLAAIRKLEEAWYVNTGTWVQIFEQRGPIEGREKLTFFRHVRGYRGAPELLEWDDAVGEPTPLKFGLTD
jgi:UDP-2,3-diacylglucosamine pyrophosphatase LpxH